MKIVVKVQLPHRSVIYFRYFWRRMAYFLPPCEVKNMLLRISGISIGKKVFVGDSVRFIDGFIKHTIRLGDQSVISPNAILISCSHPENSPLTEVSGLSRCVNLEIGSGAWIGAGSILLPGAGISPLAILGAGSVLNKQIGQNQIWAGNPARFLRNIE